MVVSLSLPDDLEERIEKAVEMGRYASKSAVIRDAIRRHLDDMGVYNMKVQLKDNTDYTNDFEYRFQKYANKHKDTPKTYTFGDTKGEGVGTYHRLNLSGKHIGVEQLENILAHIQKEFVDDMSTPVFSIRQDEGMWYGIGLSNLLTAIRDQPERYEKYEEELNLDSYKREYFSALWWFEGSLFQVSGSGYHNSNNFELNRLDLGIATKGIPSNTQKYLDFAERTGLGCSNIEEIDMLNLANYPNQQGSEDQIELELSEGLIVDNSIGKMISGGLIVENPFYQQEELISKYFDDDLDRSVSWALANLPQLYCHLMHSDKKNEERRYFLEKLTVSRTKLGDSGTRNYNFYVQARSSPPE